MNECAVFKNELFIAITSSYQADFSREAAELLTRYRALAGDRRRIWLRFHLSDIANCETDLRELLAGDDQNISIVGQAPMGGRIALEAYLLSDELKNYQLDFFNTAFGHESGIEAQTTAEFKRVEQFIAAGGGSMENNLQRTWLYCRDIDNQYAGLVKARRELFHHYGLTETSHYIASTGIEGVNLQPERLVKMDSLILYGHQKEQIEYMQDLTRLSPTRIYGVTFERGTRMIYGDRSHYYISGTASIDKDGKIVHPRNVQAQACRMLENVEGLLHNHQGSLADIKQAVVYLRDPADAWVAEAILRERLPDNVPFFLVHGAVCRPGWLIEMEAIAVNDCGKAGFKEYY